ncbi:hypothetical protein [Microbacterium sp. B19]
MIVRGHRDLERERTDGSYQTQIALIMMLVLMIARSRSFTAEEAK